MHRQAGVVQPTTLEQGDKVASQQQALCVEFTILRTTIGHLLGKMVAAFEPIVWEWVQQMGRGKGPLVQLDRGYYMVRRSLASSAFHFSYYLFMSRAACGH